MSEQAQIDGLKFAHEAQRLAGELDVADLPRLQDNLYEPAGRVGYSLVGMTDRHDHPIIVVSVQGTIPLVCQRCLGRLEFALDRQSRLLLVGPDGELPDVAQEDPDTEAIAAAEVADVADLVEQEVLLGLPLAPMHAEPCVPAPPQPEAKAESPFAVLRSLKRT
jgi:uncharacterized protein